MKEQLKCRKLLLILLFMVVLMRVGSGLGGFVEREEVLMEAVEAGHLEIITDIDDNESLKWL